MYLLHWRLLAALPGLLGGVEDRPDAWSPEGHAQPRQHAGRELGVEEGVLGVLLGHTPVKLLEALLAKPSD